ncbi:hypothetical protein KKC45_02025 [Patescibacteria group bacterium]|nr:hypothetical protein [Patescibacteria group bacterium]
MENFFIKHKEEILNALKEKASSKLSGNLTLVEGLIFADIQKDPKNITIGGNQRIPMIAVVDNETGLVHNFALKVLLPNIEI